MRLLLVNYEFPPLGGGAGNATAFLAREFVSLGAQVRVLTSGFRGLPASEQRDGYEIVRVPTIRKQVHRSSPLEMGVAMTLSMLKAVRIARSWRPDASICFFSIPGGPVGLTLKALYGIPYLVTVRGGDVPGFAYEGLAAYHRALTPAIRYLWKKSLGVVANSERLRQLAIRTSPELNVPVIPNGVDCDYFSRTDPDSGAVEPKTMTILLVGRLVQQKGVDLLLRAMATDDLRDAPLRAVIVGDGKDRQAFETLARDLELSSRVEFKGWLNKEQLRAAYWQADVLALPSRDEGMPNVLLEAMASGLACVATRLPGTEPLLGQSGEYGMFVDDPENVQGLASALRMLLDQPDLRLRLGQAAREQVKRHFTWRQAATRFLGLLHSQRLYAADYAMQSEENLR